MIGLFERHGTGIGLAIFIVFVVTAAVVNRGKLIEQRGDRVDVKGADE